MANKEITYNIDWETARGITRTVLKEDLDSLRADTHFTMSRESFLSRIGWLTTELKHSDSVQHLAAKKALYEDSWRSGGYPVMSNKLFSLVTKEPTQNE